MKTENGFLFPIKPQTVLWLHTSNHDHYIGPVRKGNFHGRGQRMLTVTIKPLVRIERVGNLDDWIPIGKFESYSFDLEFISVISKKDGEIKYRTSDGDEVILLDADTSDDEVSRLLS